MMPASIFAEAIRNGEALPIARERLAASEHVARNYRALALPAVAAAAATRLTRRATKQAGRNINGPISR